MTATKVSIANAALVHVGGYGSLTSFTDNKREAEVVAAVYPSLKRSLLVEYQWDFNTKFATFTQLSWTSDRQDWQYKYIVPADCLKIIGAENKVLYTREGGEILSNAKPFKAKYQQEVAEGEFPPEFVLLFEYRLAEILSIALAEDESKAQRYNTLAARQMQYAMALNGGQTSSKNLSTYKLIQARRM